jgi:uncharacterized protein (DUF1800 family)
VSPNPAPWARYEPSADNPWDLRKVAHLHRRAGFGATRSELLRDLEAGPADSVERLLSAREPSTQERDAAAGLRQTARASNNVDLLKAAWLNRILRGSDPLREKLTLFWHGHFATSIKKVEFIALMDGQNETLRTHALSSVSGLLKAMIDDPAMLVWLDGGDSKKSKPNENFAREFLELFTLGAGHYSETDIREAARAFTGWVRSSENRQYAPVFRRDPGQVDDGSKTFLGETGSWVPDDIVRIVLDRPEAARFLARKLYRAFVNEAEEPSPDVIEPLAGELRSRNHSVKHVVDVILRSNHFYSSSVYRQRVKSPIEFSAGLVRLLELPGAAINPLALSAACDAQGQELFAPPNVKGWDGGKVWINSSTLLQRGNWAADVVWGRPEYGLVPFDPTAWASRYGIAPAAAAEALIDLLLQGDLEDDARRIVRNTAKSGTPDALRKVLQMLINCPEFQLA